MNVALDCRLPDMISEDWKIKVLEEPRVNLFANDEGVLADAALYVFERSPQTAVYRTTLPTPLEEWVSFSGFPTETLTRSADDALSDGADPAAHSPAVARRAAPGSAHQCPRLGPFDPGAARGVAARRGHVRRGMGQLLCK